MRRITEDRRFPRCNKTGRVFHSIYDAGEYFGISHQTVINYCDKVADKRQFADIDIVWVTIQELSNEIRILKDDVYFYKNIARTKDAT